MNYQLQSFANNTRHEIQLQIDYWKEAWHIGINHLQNLTDR